MKNYHPGAELAPRDIVARSIYLERQRTQNHIYLDFSALRSSVKNRFPTIYKRCLDVGFDITRDYIPVSPAAHYFMGGIQTSISGQTTINHLYAIGEVASLGLHGANRLASNSLLEGLVFGSRAATHALETLSANTHTAPHPPPTKTRSPHPRKRTTTPCNQTTHPFHYVARSQYYSLTDVIRKSLHLFRKTKMDPYH